MKTTFRFAFVWLVFSPCFLFSQSLSRERVAQLKKTVVRITIDGSSSMGTGFFISELGEVLTCWHVIDSALIKDFSGSIVSMRKIYIEMSDGKKMEMGIPTAYFYDVDVNTVAIANDFCHLTPAPIPFDHKVDFLKLGNFDSTYEGDDVYTAGYPLGMPFQFISMGILSSKHFITITHTPAGKPPVIIKRPVALLDLTLNKGNSGGPIIRPGKTAKDDRVIGIADFLVNPFGKNAEDLSKAIGKERNLMLSADVSLTESMKLFSNAIIYSTNGIGGCVSINQFLSILK